MKETIPTYWLSFKFTYVVVYHHRLTFIQQMENPTVSVEFVFNGLLKQQIRIENPSQLDLNYVSPASSVSNTTFEYSGRHDHGNLPILKTSGPCAELVSALQDAKRECDKYLTNLINEEFGYDDSDKIVEGDGAEEDIVESKPKKQCTEANIAVGGLKS